MLFSCIYFFSIQDNQALAETIVIVHTQKYAVKPGVVEESVWTYIQEGEKVKLLS